MTATRQQVYALARKFLRHNHAIEHREYYEELKRSTDHSTPICYNRAVTRLTIKYREEYNELIKQCKKSEGYQ